MCQSWLLFEGVPRRRRAAVREEIVLSVNRGRVVHDERHRCVRFRRAKRTKIQYGTDGCLWY